MRSGCSWLVALFLLWACQIGASRSAGAQLLTSLFPEGVPGYGSEQGVTVRSRARPAFDPLGLRWGSLSIRPLLSETIGYDNNVFGGPVRRGAWEIATRPSILMGSASAAGSFGMFLSADDIRYLNQAAQNRTDGAAFVGGTIDLGRDKLTLGAGYLARHEDRTELDALPSDRPVAFQVANTRASYTAALGRITATPAIELNRWRFGDTTILGVPVSESTRDRTTAKGEITLRFAWMPGRDLLLASRMIETHYDHPAAGVASNNATSWLALAGIDYDDDTVWRYRLLAGVQFRQPVSAAVASQTAGIVEADVTWSPSGLTTARAAVTRGIEDAAQTGLSSFTYTSATLTLDHELLRDILLNASASIRQATFNQTGGQQLGLAFGAGATWLINRTLWLSLTHDFSDVRNARLPSGTLAGNYARNLTLLTLRLGL